uniref:Uncharacterized protein n=1 Tax=Calcidiscus leptoporus TaxID=127549 RepID=A0A7S0IKT0_9EUKA|mmetsp:Transcript_11833/g.27348  ORF Transcript_11833/g.27348 Transcript_11833/m.27348 type:complete len:138 (+) Transcript_11833:2-415(+)
MTVRSDIALLVDVGLVAVGRQFVYSTLFASLQRSTGANFGRLAGLANLAVAFTALLQAALINVSEACARSGWGVWTFAPANAAFLTLTALLCMQPICCTRVPAPDRRVLPATASSKSLQVALLGLGSSTSAACQRPP